MIYVFEGVPQYDPKTPWTPASASMAVFIILSASLIAPPLVFAWFTGIRQSTWESSLLALGENTSPILAAAQASLAIALVWLVSGARGGERKSVLLLNWPKTSISTTINLIGIAYILVNVVGFITKVLFPHGHHEQLLVVRAGTTQSYRFLWSVLGSITLLLLSPISEDFLFRGFLLGALSKSKLNFWPSAAMVSLIWAAVHFRYPLSALPTLFLFGLALSYILVRTGSIWACVFAHGLFNLEPAVFRLLYAGY